MNSGHLVLPDFVLRHRATRYDVGTVLGTSFEGKVARMLSFAEDGTLR